jgi:hypothetical protein
MRAYQKKKVYRLMVKKNAKAGLINNDQGQWVNNDGSNSMKRDFKGGHRVA